MALLSWRFERSDGVVLDRVELEEDGGISRLLTHPPSGPAPELGWWSGAFEPGSLAAARTLAASDWSAAPTHAPPALAGRWLVTRSDGALLPLDGVDADLPAQLSAIRGAAIDAATIAMHVVRVTCRWRSVGDERLPLLDVASVGSGDVSLRIDPGAVGVEAAFLNDDAETLGFVGDDLTLAPGTHAFALLRLATEDGVLRVAGLASGGEVPSAGEREAASLLVARPGSAGVPVEARVDVVDDE